MRLLKTHLPPLIKALKSQSLPTSSLTSLSFFLCFFDGGGSSPGTMTLSCVPGCELLPLCVASCVSVFNSACIALMHLERSEIAFAVDCSPLSLFWRLMMLHTQPRCHSQENSQLKETSWCFYSVDVILRFFLSRDFKMTVTSSYLCQIHVDRK